MSSHRHRLAPCHRPPAPPFMPKFGPIIKGEASRIQIGRFLADCVQPIAQAHGGWWVLPSPSRRGRVDRGHKDQLATLGRARLRHEFLADLGLVMPPEGQQMFGRNVQFRADLLYRAFLRPRGRFRYLSWKLMCPPLRYGVAFCYGYIGAARVEQGRLRQFWRQFRRGGFPLCGHAGKKARGVRAPRALMSS